MSLKKTAAIAAAVGALAAISVPAMALENEFHGMYKFIGYQSNFFNGSGANLGKDTVSGSGFMAEQRARIQYTAKANADLKLVTHFELDTRFGGKAPSEGYLGTTNTDAGGLDADQLSLETKNIYLDFNCPITGTNFKAGMQPWADSYQSLFLLADMTGVSATKKIGSLASTLAWFRFDDNTAKGEKNVGLQTADLFVANANYSITKDIAVGASYYFIQDDTDEIAGANATWTPATEKFVPGISKTSRATSFETLHMVGLDANLTFGPANIKPFAAIQFGDEEKAESAKLRASMLGMTSKTKVGSGAINLSAVYLSGDRDNDGSIGGSKSFRTVNATQTYFNASNMWLLVRNGQAINSSTSILGNDMTNAGAGFVGVFGGYEGTAGKVFYNANAGYAQAAKGTGNGSDKGIGTEVNAQVGYKLYDNLSASVAFAYAFLGSKYSAAQIDDPYAANVQLSYTF